MDDEGLYVAVNSEPLGTSYLREIEPLTRAGGTSSGTLIAYCPACTPPAMGVHCVSAALVSGPSQTHVVFGFGEQAQLVSCSDCSLLYLLRQHEAEALPTREDAYVRARIMLSHKAPAPKQRCQDLGGTP